MKLEEQICSLELAKKLKELGIKQESHFKWVQVYHPEHGIGAPHIQWDVTEDYNDTLIHNDWKMTSWSAFTVAELGELLPESININNKDNDIIFEKVTFKTTNKCHYICSLVEDGGYHADFVEYECSDTNEANARAKMLIYLIEIGHVKV